MNMTRFVAIACLVLVASLVARPAFAQATSYQANFYNVGASTPVQSETFAASAPVCNQAPPPATASTVNPTRIVFDDKAVAGRVCIFSEATAGPLFSLPVGNYEGTVMAINAAGPGAESGRVPFSRLAPETALTNVRFAR